MQQLYMQRALHLITTGNEATSAIVQCRASNSNTRQRNTTLYTRNQPFDRDDVSRCSEDYFEVGHKAGYGGYFGSDNKDSFPSNNYNCDGGARDDPAVQSNPVARGMDGGYPYQPVSGTKILLWDNSSDILTQINEVAHGNPPTHDTALDFHQDSMVT